MARLAAPTLRAHQALPPARGGAADRSERTMELDWPSVGSTARARIPCSVGHTLRWPDEARRLGNSAAADYKPRACDCQIRFAKSIGQVLGEVGQLHTESRPPSRCG